MFVYKYNGKHKKNVIRLNGMFFKMFSFLFYSRAINIQAPVPGKPINANRGLNLANPGLKFILRLDSLPKSTINTNQVINKGLNLNLTP